MSNNILNSNNSSSTSNSLHHHHLQNLHSSPGRQTAHNSFGSLDHFTQQSKMIPNTTPNKKLSLLNNIDDAASAFSPLNNVNSSILNKNNSSNNNSNSNGNGGGGLSLPSLSDQIHWNSQQQQQQSQSSHHHSSSSSTGISPILITPSQSSSEKHGNIIDAPSSPEFSNQSNHSHQSNQQSQASRYDKMMSDTTNVRLQQYEAHIESLMNQVQTAFEREQKQRIYTKSIEESYSTLEAENLKLKKEVFELTKKLNEVIQMKMPPSFSPQPNTTSSIPNSKFTSPLAISGSLPPPPNHSDKKKMELKKKNRGSVDGGDEELVAEALGSFVELTSTSSSRKPMLKRSNSEDSFRHAPPMMSPHSIMLSRGNLPIGGDNPSSSMEWAMSGSPSEFDDLRFKKRRSDQFNSPPPMLDPIMKPVAGGVTSTPGSGKKHPFNPSSPPNLPRHNSFSMVPSPIKLEHISNNSNNNSSNNISLSNNSSTGNLQNSISGMDLNTSPNNNNNNNASIVPNPLSSSGGIQKKSKKSSSSSSGGVGNSGGHFPSQMKNISQLPEMDTDVDSTDEFEFKGSTGMPGGVGRHGDGGDSPDSNENSRNSSSPIEAPMSDANLFKSLTNDTPHEALLNEIHHLHSMQRESLEKIHITQKQFLGSDGASNHDDIYMALQADQKKLATQIESELQTLNQMYSQTILEPNQLCKLDILLQDLSIQHKQLQLYQNELSGGPEIPVALVITKQPFPMVISKYKQLQEDHLTVQLLVGSNLDIVSYSPIRAELIFHSKALTKGAAPLIGGIGAVSSGSNSKRHIENDTQSIDLTKGIAKFPIKFLTGTRKGCVKLHFVLQIKTSDGHVYNVPSSTSQPFIVITNDCQWEGSEGTLLKKESFNEKFEITWPHFVNILQKHFLKATKQSPIQPTRPLSSYDFFYLNTAFFGSRSFVSHKDFDQFWTWFGKSLQTLRYKRHISTLWQNGLIFMFLKRESVNNILKGQEPGTFVILFSEMYPGQLEISYVGLDKDIKSENSLSDSNDGKPSTKIKHYLVQPNDTSGSKRTLPDFLNECPQFTHILQLNVSQLSHTESTIPPFRRELKNTVLEPYYSKRQNSQSFLGNGYDPLN